MEGITMYPYMISALAYGLSKFIYSCGIMFYVLHSAVMCNHGSITHTCVPQNRLLKLHCTHG